MSTRTTRTYIVTADNVAPAHMIELVDRLRQAGFVVTQQLDAAGVIIGSADEATVSQLRRLPGVAAIEEERTFHLPSDESDSK